MCINIHRVKTYGKENTIDKKVLRISQEISASRLATGNDKKKETVCKQVKLYEIKKSPYL